MADRITGAGDQLRMQRRVGHFAGRPQSVDGTRQGELGSAQPGDEVPAAHLTALFEHLQHGVRRGVTSPDTFGQHRLARDDAVPLEQLQRSCVRRLRSVTGAGERCGASNDQRPAPAGGPMRVRRPGRGRPRGAVDERDVVVPPDSTARNGASESLVTSPAHTRSHKAASSSASVAPAEAARS